MRRWQTVSLLLILLLRLPYASAQDLRQCKMPDGRTVLTNEPCPGEERKAAPPQPVPRERVPGTPVTKSEVITEPRANDEKLPRHRCLEIQYLNFKFLAHRALYTELSWKVDIWNRCKEQFQPWVVFSIQDKEGFQLDSQTARGFVPANDMGHAHGVLLVQDGLLKRIATQHAIIRW